MKEFINKFMTPIPHLSSRWELVVELAELSNYLVGVIGGASD